jgi:hypothetical protein
MRRSQRYRTGAMPRCLRQNTRNVRSGTPVAAHISVM